MSARRQRAEAFGRWAEYFAMLVLFLKGYRLLDHRARTAAGEIDLVARRGDVLAFIEVKARASLDEARQALSFHQTRRLTRAATIWRSGRPSLHHLAMRYDLVLVAPWQWPRHERAAWEPEEHIARDLL
ncbi:YraN family protein [Maricaulis sp.]|uniref:YraN family protein n=1 Tax=Maricaulis sp. TaxID=1486257 RepID=UPI001B16E8B5|nr:YraN family protein [Maricaulis sp.]MBO6795715.1 YraN family protein [Maricaulis sp.]